ncbi:MAG: pyruvate formate lyase family protein, partial [Calditrichaceae bacterium]
MNERIQRLREQSLGAKPSISMERAVLLTEFYQSQISEQSSVPVQRALAFKYILENKKICINPGELIVGERGPQPKATPTYPEVCLHSPQDLDTLNSREKIPYSLKTEDKLIHENKIIPFWKGKSVRQRIFREISSEWQEAYEAGIFTEFMEQRSPGHTALDGKIYKKGMKDFIKDIKKSIAKLDFYNDPQALDKREELQAMEICAQAVIEYAKRHSKLLKKLAEEETLNERKRELEDIAGICTRVPANAPQTFHEALQYYWFVHIGVITELNPWDAFNPGRLDQHLYPFYKKEFASGELTQEKARELLQAFWIKFNNQPAPPKVGVT